MRPKRLGRGSDRGSNDVSRPVDADKKKRKHFYSAYRARGVLLPDIAGKMIAIVAIVDYC